MDIEAFISSLSQPQPPVEISGPLRAIWYDGKNDWHSAHEIAQDLASAEGAWIHAYLHRKEGDSSNAAYWYRRANRPVPDISLKDEWRQIAKTLLQSQE
jgi:hypothetical protein